MEAFTLRSADELTTASPILLALIQLLQLWAAIHTRLGISLQLRNNPILFLAHIPLHLILGNGEVEISFGEDDHAAEILPDKVVEEFGSSVAGIDVVFGEDFVGEVGAGFEGEFF